MNLQLSDLICELPKSTIPAKSAIVGGQYVFYVSGPTPLQCDYACRNGDALILSTGGNAAVHFGEGSFTYSTDCWALEPIHEKVDGKFLYYHLSSQIARIDALGFEGSGLRHLRKDFIRHYPVPKFPRCEQTKIAEVLSTVDRAIEQTEALIAKQQRIKTGLMQDLLTRGIDHDGNLRSEETHEFKNSHLGRIPVEWDVEELGGFCDVTSSKRIFFRDYRKEGVPFYRSKEIIELVREGSTPGELFIEEKKYSEIKRKFGVPINGDILVSSVGTLGVCYLVKINDQFYFKDGNLIWFRYFNKEVNRKFLVNLLPRMINYQFDNLVIGTSQKAFTIEKLKRLKLFVPSLDEQSKIADLIQRLQSTLNCKLACLHKLRSLKTALMQDLLTGKVRVTPLLNETQEAVA